MKAAKEGPCTAADNEWAIAYRNLYDQRKEKWTDNADQKIVWQVNTQN